MKVYTVYTTFDAHAKGSMHYFQNAHRSPRGVENRKGVLFNNSISSHGDDDEILGFL